MGKPWYRSDSGLYEAMCREVEDAYPDLHFRDDGARVVLRGWYPLCEGSRVWDRYQVEIVLSKESSRDLPAVYEVGNRIPRDLDRHMEGDGKACIVLPDAFWYDYPNGMSLREFLDGPVRHYFVSQSLIEQGYTNVWDRGEWAHGIAGTLQFYQEVTGSDDPAVIFEYLKLMARDEIKGHWPCPCGSGRKLRTCHKALIYDLRSRIPRKVAVRSLQNFVAAAKRAAKQGRVKA